MNMKLSFELGELLLCVGYLIFSKRNHQPHTKQLIALSSFLLIIDIFFLKGERPSWIWAIMNIPAGVIVYEKILRQTLVSIYKRLTAFVALLFD